MRLISFPGEPFEALGRCPSTAHPAHPVDEVGLMFSCFFATSALRPIDDIMALGGPGPKNVDREEILQG